MCTYQGQEITLRVCARLVGIDYHALYQRLFTNKMPLERALSRPSIQEPAYQAALDDRHEGGCTCKRCKKIARSVKKFKKMDPQPTPILAPNPEDDGRWFKIKGEICIEYESKLYRISQLAENVGMSTLLLRARLSKRRWTIERAIALPKISRKQELEHGTKYAYDHYKCRCDRCRQVNNDYSRKYYWEKGLNKAAKPTKRKGRSTVKACVPDA